MSFPEWRQTKEKIAMGEKVGRILTFMKDTACVHLDEREIIAWCKIYGMVNPDDKEFNGFLESVVVPALIKLGRARWYRDTLTDLAFALSGRERKKVVEDAKYILEE